MACLNDILIFSETYAGYDKYLRMVLQGLREEILSVILSECKFHKEKVAYLGYMSYETG